MAKVESSGAAAVALSALRAQHARVRVLAQNMANSSSTGSTPGAEPSATDAGLQARGARRWRPNGPIGFREGV